MGAALGIGLGETSWLRAAIEKEEMVKFIDYLCDRVVLLDGGMGTMLQAAGLKPGELPERWNVSHPDCIVAVHRAYYDAGSNVVLTNTFGANALKYSLDELEELVPAAVENARTARDTSVSDAPKFIALDLGPTGQLLEPYGDLEFEEAVQAFAPVVRLGAQSGIDLVVIETMMDAEETRAAIQAVKESCDLPFVVSNAYAEGGRTMMGSSPADMVRIAQESGACAVGANCSLGPVQLRPVAQEMIAASSLPVLCKPNAGLPRRENGQSVYDVTPEQFAQEAVALVEAGVRLIGGCCGTTPEYIAALSKRVSR